MIVCLRCLLSSLLRAKGLLRAQVRFVFALLFCAFVLCVVVCVVLCRLCVCFCRSLCLFHSSFVWTGFVDRSLYDVRCHFHPNGLFTLDFFEPMLCTPWQCPISPSSLSVRWPGSTRTQNAQTQTAQSTATPTTTTATTATPQSVSVSASTTSTSSPSGGSGSSS